VGRAEVPHPQPRDADYLDWANRRGKYADGGARYRIWAWPTEQALLSKPSTWDEDSSSPANIDWLSESLSHYIERPWLQHNVIDGAAINALLFSALASGRQVYRMTVTNWLDYLLSGGKDLRLLWITPLLKVVRFFLRWIMLPAVAAGLITARYHSAANYVLGT